MELLLELLVWLLEMLFETAIEVGLQALADVVGHSARRKLRPRKPLHPMLVASMCLAAGWLAGMLSLWLFPEVAIKAQWLRMVGLLLVPLAAASLMALFGSWRRKNDKDVSALERFSYGFCFAFMISLVRFMWGTGV